MALVNELYPAKSNDNYVIAGQRTRHDGLDPLSLIETADDESQLGRNLAIQYFSRTGGAPISYEIPQDVQKELNVRPLSPSERERFTQAFLSSRDW
jgi:hypothetical protein